MPYLRTGKVPTHWAQLVSQSAEFTVTDNSSATWESLSPPSQSDEGDFSTEHDAPAGTNSSALRANIIEESTSIEKAELLLQWRRT